MKLRILLLIIYSAWKVECNSEIKIHDLQFNGNFSQIIYKRKIFLPKLSSSDITLNETNYSYEFAIMQAHCHHQQISISLETSTNESIIQYGTNIGFLLKADHSEKVFKLVNNNNDEVHCLIALIAYPKSTPIPGNCVEHTNSTNVEMIKLIEEPKILTAVIPIAHENSNACNESELTYETYYTYIDMMDFSFDAYFEGIERVLYDSITSAYQAKHGPIPNRHLFEKIPGRAIIVNTVVKGKNGKMAYFVPVASYSCAPNTWSSHCTENNIVKKGFSIVLILFSVIMILNLMAPDFIESILNGMLFGGFGTILFIESFGFGLQGFDYFITVIVGSFVVSAVLGFITIYFAIGRFLSKFTLSLFFVLFFMEIFFDTITSAYLEVIFALILSILLSFVPITCAVILGSLMLVLNISFLFKYGNLHRFMINNYLALTTLPVESINETYYDFIRPNFINYTVTLTYVDYFLLVLYIALSIYFTIRKEEFFSGHPEALEQRVVPHDNYSRMIQERNAWAKARHRDFIDQYGIEHDVGHYGPVKGCKGHNIKVIRALHPKIDHVDYPLNRPPQIDVECSTYIPPSEAHTLPSKVFTNTRCEGHPENLGQHCIHCPDFKEETEIDDTSTKPVSSESSSRSHSPQNLAHFKSPANSDKSQSPANSDTSSGLTNSERSTKSPSPQRKDSIDSNDIFHDPEPESENQEEENTENQQNRRRSPASNDSYDQIDVLGSTDIKN